MRWDDQQTSQVERGCSPRWCSIAYSLPGLHKWHHNHSAKTCAKHSACRWLCSMVRWRTYHHSCPPYPEYHQRGVQLDRELGTTAQHNQDGQHTLHTVHRKGEGLNKIKQPASSTGWDANVSWGNPRYTLDVKTTPWSEGHQKSGHHEETCRNHLGGQLRHPETGLHRGCKTSRRVCLHNLGCCLKNQQKQARQSAEHGPENYLRCYEKDTNPTNGKDYRPSTFGVQKWVQSCHPRGKAEEIDQSSTPPETSAWNQKPPEKKELQAQVEKPTKRKCWSSGGRSRKIWGAHNEGWASRKSLPEVRTEIPGLAAKGTQAPELQKALTLEMIQDCYPKSTWTHVFTDGSAENAVRNGGSGAYIRRPDGTTSSLSIPAGDLSSNCRAEVHTLKAATELLIEEDCNQQNIVLLSDSLSALQSLTNGPTDFRTQQLHNSLRTLSDNNRVVHQWVPTHVGIAGNETADRLAKAAAKLPQPHFSTTYKEVKTLLKQKQKSAWRLKNKGYDPQKYQINTLDRRTQTTIFRLRTGQCGLRKHLKRL